MLVDVLTAVLAGGIGAAAGWYVSRWLERRADVDEEEPEDG